MVWFGKSAVNFAKVSLLSFWLAQGALAHDNKNNTPPYADHMANDVEYLGVATKWNVDRFLVHLDDDSLIPRTSYVKWKWEKNARDNSEPLKVTFGTKWVSVINWKNTYKASFEQSELFWTILWFQYGFFNWEWGTLVDVKIWDKNKSFLLTWMYKWVDWSVRSSVGMLFQDFEWQTIKQDFAWLEVIKDLDKYIKWLSASWYLNATHTSSAILSVTEERIKVPWGTWLITTTTSYKWWDNVGWWIWFKYDFGNNSIEWHAGTFWWKIAFWGSYEYANWDFKAGVWIDCVNEICQSTARVDILLYPGLTVWLSWTMINWPIDDDTQVGLNVAYTPWLNTFSNSSKKWGLDFRPVVWAEHAMRTLYGKKEITKTEVFIPDPVEVDKIAPELSSTNKTFVTDAWKSLVLENVTANDNKDWVIWVVITWTVDFNTAWTYYVIYTATDKAGNISKIVHTYIVLEPIVKPWAPELTWTWLTLRTEVWAPFSEPVVSAKDSKGNELKVTKTGELNINIAGTYILKYTAEDPETKVTTKWENIFIVYSGEVIDTKPPVINSTNQEFRTTVWNRLTLQTVTATDDKDWTFIVKPIWEVDFDKPWISDIEYSAKDKAWNNAVTIIHRYIVEEAPNNLPTGQDIKVDAFAKSYSLNLTPYLTDEDWDTVTAQMVLYELTKWDLSWISASILWNVVNITVRSGYWEVTIYYEVSDWKDTNPTRYRLTISNLNWELDE